MNNPHHFTLVRDSRPTSQNINAATDAYWAHSLKSLVEGHFFCGFNEAHIGFDATFKVEQGKVRCTLTPTTDKGKNKFTHLRKWFWMKLEPKLTQETLTIINQPS